MIRTVGVTAMTVEGERLSRAAIAEKCGVPSLTGLALRQCPAVTPLGMTRHMTIIRHSLCWKMSLCFVKTGPERCAPKAAPDLLQTRAPQSTPETDGAFHDFLNDPRRSGAITAFQPSGSFGCWVAKQIAKQFFAVSGALIAGKIRKVLRLND